MKIAMIGQKQIPSREGGVEIVVEELATRMVLRGHAVTCYNRSLSQKKTPKNYKGVKLIKNFTIRKKGLAAMTSSLIGSIKILFSNCDVVHYHAEGPCTMIWIPKFFSHKRILATIHGLDWQRSKWSGFATKYIHWGEKMAVRYADEIIVLSRNMQDYFWNTYRRRTCFIPNAISKPEKRDANIIRQAYGLEKDSYILFLGRIVPEKGVHYLIEAFKALSTSKKLVIAGGSSDTEEYFHSLKKQAIGNKNILFTGFVEGEILEELYSNCYLYCLPSDLEGMPMSLLEAMSYGNCCLVSDIAECREVVEKKAITFRAGSVASLKQALNRLLQNEKIVQKYKEQAQSFILKKYNWEQVVTETLKLYERGEGSHDEAKN